MAKLEHGSVKITLPDGLDLPDKAGKLTPEEQQRVARAPRDIGRACEDAAELLDKAGASLPLPADVSAAALRQAASRADGFDRVIADVELLLTTLKQANLLADAEAWETLRKLYAVVKSQEPFNPQIGAQFAPLGEYFSRRGTGTKPAQPASEEPVA